MHIEDIKRWHWAVVGVIVGLAMGYVWTSMSGQGNLPTLGADDFERGLMSAENSDGSLKTITIMPLSSDRKHLVIADVVVDRGVAGKRDLQRRALATDVPYRAGAWRGADEQYPNVIEFLKEIKKNNPQTPDFKYAWFRETWAVYSLWTSACVLLIGGVWPSVISLMVGAGLGFHKEEKGPDYDLSRFKSEAAKKAGATGPTAADMDQLHKLDDELERKLAGDGAGVAVGAGQGAAANGEARKLDGGPLEAATSAGPGEEHEYKGEFYPVDRGVKKK